MFDRLEIPAGGTGLGIIAASMTGSLYYAAVAVIGYLVGALIGYHLRKAE